MIPVQNVSLGQNAHRSFTAIETIHNSTVHEVNCREYHTAHSVAQHINNWRSFLLFATRFESYRSYAETILTSNPFSPNICIQNAGVLRCDELKTYSSTQTYLLTMHAVIINTALLSESMLHGYYIGDDVMPVGLLLHQWGEKKNRQLSRANEWYTHYIWWGGNDTISLTLSHDCKGMPSGVEGCH
jgi:hypothetical protein